MVVGGASAPGALAGWGRPFRISQPFSLDVLPAQVALSPAGAAAVGVTVTDADAAANSTAYAVMRDSSGAVGTVKPVPSAQQVLGLAFAAGGVELLTGSSDPGDACCGSVGVVRMSTGGGFSGGRSLVGGLAGATQGQLIPVSGRLVAAIATERGVWVTQSSRAARFGRVHRLTSPEARPETFSAAPLAAGSAIVAWAQRDKGNSDPRTIYVAVGTARSAPVKRRSTVTVTSSIASTRSRSRVPAARRSHGSRAGLTSKAATTPRWR